MKKIYHSQLHQTLTQSSWPVWLVFGDEPWQKQNSLIAIKQQLQQQGFSELIRFTVDDKFDWQLVLQEYQSLSLFASQRVIELELMSVKLNDVATKSIEQICQQLQQDVVILIHGDKLDAATQKRKWFKQLAEHACFLPLYDIDGKHLNQWIQKQARHYKVNMLPDVVFLLAEFFEGNLNALDQELQKLSLLFGQQLITTEQAQELLIKQAKFNPFQLIDALLEGNLAKCVGMLDQLQHDGTAIGQLIWFVHKEIKQLSSMHGRMQQGEDFNSLAKEFRIWDKRKPLYQKALNNITPSNLDIAISRLADVDLTIKTASDFNPFLLLADVITSLYQGDKLKSLALNYEYA